MIKDLLIVLAGLFGFLFLWGWFAEYYQNKQKMKKKIIIERGSLTEPKAIALENLLANKTNKMKLKIELLIEVEDEIWGLNDKEAREWFENECLNPDQLYLHSNEAGDEIGKIIEVKYKFENE